MLGLFKKKYRTIDPQTFKEMKVLRDTVILDVRTRAEQIGGVINGQRNLNVTDKKFRENVDKLDRSKTYLIYCQRGARGARAARIMAGLGFEKVYNLKGGFNAWDREFG